MFIARAKTILELDVEAGVSPARFHSSRPARAPLHKTTAFTLLEIALAVAILGMMSLAIYRFVQSNIVSLRVSAETTATDATWDGLRDLLTAQWQTLPMGKGALTGEPLKLNDRPRDEIKWTCSAGPGLLTRYAPGEFTVNMRLQPADKKTRPARSRFSAQTERRPIDHE
jgi:hypothetical protein